MLTTETKAALHRAVDAAQGYGACSYLQGCVVACFLKDTGRQELYERAVWAEEKADEYSWGCGKLSVDDYSLDELLRDLQHEWDTGKLETFGSEDQTRRVMHKLIDEAQ